MKRRAYDEEFGFGEILAEDGDEILVRFDADPWFPQWIPKEKEEK